MNNKIDIPKLAACAENLFDLSNLRNTFTEQECEKWLFQANEATRLLSIAVFKRFQGLDDKVIAANKKINLVQAKLENELSVQQNIVSTVNAVADLLSVVEELLVLA